MDDGAALPPEEELEDALRDRVFAARSGLRRDVQALLLALQDHELFVPLTSRLEGTTDGQLVELEGGTALCPHLLLDEDHELFCPLFTDEDLLEEMAAALGWQTDGGPLQVATLPALVALQMAAGVVDEESVRALTLNPGDESELFLQRAEALSLVAGRAIPLVGYVRHFAEEGEPLAPSSSSAPVPEGLSHAVGECLREFPEVRAWELLHGFDAERDLDPHWTLRLTARGSELRPETLGPRLQAAVDGHVPPPGYLDLVVVEPKGSDS